jgi:hypothetical protein
MGKYVILPVPVGLYRPFASPVPVMTPPLAATVLGLVKSSRKTQGGSKP